MENTITLLSWNVNGIRAAYRKGFMDWLEQAQPDVLGIQEIRAEEDQLPKKLAQPEGYHGYWNSCKRKKGYSGTAILSKLEPLSVEYGLGIEEFDQEGRTVTATYPTFTLLTSYFPNGGRDASRVPFKMDFYAAFLEKCNRLRDAGQTVIFCGDVNTAHNEIDLARPQSNRKSTGFLPIERAWIDDVLAAGYADTFRTLYPETGDAYSWWSVPTKARARNVGWRLDYFFIDAKAMDRVADAFILPDVQGSDHCPVGIQLRI